MRSLIKSFRCSIEGLLELIKSERNFQLHILALVIVIAFGFYLNISSEHWISILLVSALVLSLEAVNTSIEKLCDFHHPDIHPDIKKIKDIAAGAVVIAALTSVIIGVVIFSQYI